jgi:phage RecT family recombinase
VSTEVIKAPEGSLEQAAQQTLYSWLKKYERSIKNVLPAHLNPERLQWLIINNIRTTPALAGVTPQSFINAVLLASNMGVEIRKNSAYLIPMGKECTLVVDYKSYIDLAARAGVTIYPPQLVRENDIFEYGHTQDGLKFRHEFDMKRVAERGEVFAGWCMADTKENRRVVDVMFLADIEKIRAKAKKGCYHDFDHYGKRCKGLKSLSEVREMADRELAYRDPYNTPWVVWWNEMAEKTLIRSLYNRIPQTEQMALAQAVSDAENTGEAIEAPQMAELEIDPEDNHPMVPQLTEAEQLQIGQHKAVEMAKAQGASPAKLNELEQQFSLSAKKGGKA